MSFLAKRNISINWFFFNQLPESLIEPTSNYIIMKYQKNIIASAGGGAFNYQIDSSPIIIDTLLLDYINANYNYTELINVIGDSMKPSIPDNSLVFIDKSKKKYLKGIYAIYMDNSLYIKRLKFVDKKLIIISDNKQYISIEANEIEIVGKVIGVFSKVL